MRFISTKYMCSQWVNSIHSYEWRSRCVYPYVYLFACLVASISFGHACIHRHNKYVCVCKYVCIHASNHACLRICVRIYILNARACVCTCVCTMYAWIYVCHACMCVYICTYMSMCVCMHACMQFWLWVSWFLVELICSSWFKSIKSIIVFIFMSI